MSGPRFICFKRSVIGFAASCLAVTVTVWALATYVPRRAPVLFAVGAAFATFYCMTLALRAAVREAYRAGEVGRRLPARRTPRSIMAAPLRGRPELAARTIFSADDTLDSSPEEDPVALTPTGSPHE